MSKKMDGLYDPRIAECIAIREGLSFSKEYGFHVHDIQSDSLYSKWCVLGSLIGNIIALTGGGTCTHISREGNMVAHALARHSISFQSNMFNLEEFPPFVASFVEADSG